MPLLYRALEPIISSQSSSQPRTPQACALLANLNCLVLDFVARQKIGGTSLTYFYLYQFPVLPPEAYTAASLDFVVSRALELTYTSHSITPFARDLGYEGEPFGWDEQRRVILSAELDAWYARAYGLTRDELRYILDPTDVMGCDYPSENIPSAQKQRAAPIWGVPYAAPGAGCLGPNGTRGTSPPRAL